MRCVPACEVHREATVEHCGSPANAGDTYALTEQVVELLVDRVPAGVLDRVLLELGEAHRADSAEDLRALLERGCLTGRYRSLRGQGGYLIGVRTAEPARLVSRLRLHADAYRYDLAVYSSGGTVWVLLLNGPRPDVTALLEQPDLASHLALGRQVDELRATPVHRSGLEELLDVGVRLGWRGLVDTTRLDAIRRVEALLDLAAQRPELLEGPLDLLFNDEGSVLADTLFHWFALNRDTAATAVAMHLHVNTVRYRLRRAQDLTGVDLSDWNQRLLAELQLRLWRDAHDPVDLPSPSPVRSLGDLTESASA